MDSSVLAQSDTVGFTWRVRVTWRAVWAPRTTSHKRLRTAAMLLCGLLHNTAGLPLHVSLHLRPSQRVHLTKPDRMLCAAAGGVSLTAPTPQLRATPPHGHKFLTTLATHIHKSTQIHSNNVGAVIPANPKAWSLSPARLRGVGHWTTIAAGVLHLTRALHGVVFDCGVSCCVSALRTFHKLALC